MTFNICPLNAEWAMLEPKKGSPTKQEAAKGGLMKLKYTYKFKSEYGESCDEWLDAIDEKYNEVLGNFVKKEDEASTAAFRAKGKTRLNSVFDAKASFTKNTLT